MQRTLKARDGELFVSEPLKQAVDVAGVLRGQLDFRSTRWIWISSCPLRAAAERRLREAVRSGLRLPRELQPGSGEASPSACRRTAAANVPGRAYDTARHDAAAKSVDRWRPRHQ